MLPVPTEPELPPPLPGLRAQCAPDDEREALILPHMEDVRQIARTVAWRLPATVQLDDLVQAGALGLLDAAGRYDRGRRMMFRHYARIPITGAIFDSLRELDWASRYLRGRKQQLAHATRSLETRLGRAATSEELAEALGMDLDSFYEFAGAVRDWKTVELDADEGEERRPLLEQLATRPEDSPEAEMLYEELRAKVRRAVRELPAAEREVVTLYDYGGWTMEAIARRIGRTESRVSQIHARAIERLQRRFAERLDGSVPKQQENNVSTRIQ